MRKVDGGRNEERVGGRTIMDAIFSTTEELEMIVGLDGSQLFPDSNIALHSRSIMQGESYLEELIAGQGPDNVECDNRYGNLTHWYWNSASAASQLVKWRAS